TPEDVETMRRLRGLGWGTKRIAAELGCSRNTVKRWLALDGWQPYGRPRRGRALDGLKAWLEERFHRHAGNADVVHQELVAEHGVAVSLRTVERAVAPFRRDLAARARATVRFETPPGRQLQIDFGERRVVIAGESVRGICSSRRSATRAGATCERSGTSASPAGSKASRAPSRTSAACRRRCCSTTRGRSSCTTTRRRARCASTSGSWPSRPTGASGRGLARRTGRARRARTSGASAT